MAKTKGQTAGGISPLSSIKAKFASLVIGATLVSCTAVGLLSYEMGKTGLIDASKLRLEAIAQNQTEHVETYTNRLNQSLAELSTNTAIGEAISNMAYALTFEKDQILSTFEPKGKSAAERAAFEPEKSKLIYAMHHAKVHAGLYSAWKNANASDIYILDDKGTIVYSVTKSREFLGNVSDPGNEAMKSMFDKMVAGGNNDVQTSDFVPFKADDGSNSLFLGRPVLASEWGDIKRKGYIVFRVSDAKFAPIVADPKVLKQVGNIFMTARDGTFRAGSIKGGKVPAAVASLAKNEKAGAAEVSSGDSDTFYSYLPVHIFGHDHMLFAGQPMADVLAPAKKLAMGAILVTLAVVGIMAVLGFFVSSRLTRPLIDLTQLMNRLIAGDKEIEIKSVGRKDEIGVMAAALETFRKNALDKDRMEHEAAEQSRMSDAERQQREAEKARSAEELEAAVSALAGALQALSRGELATRIDTPFVPALDQLRRDFNESVERLEETVKAIGVSTDAIQAGSSSLKSASEDLARRTERQAASLEEAAAALTEMTESVNSTRNRCETADTVASSALKDTLSSGSVVKDAIAAMERIESSSGQIRTIIDVIDQIAFQTNLLALNAGVEAARAGDAGKGFAVVAQEVRELAQKSAAAASDISGIITTSASDVENGVNLVLKTGKSLQTIEENVKLIHEHIGEIVSATRDQSDRLAEINSSVNDLDHVTQQNAAMVEETTAAAFSLDREAGVLMTQVSAFSTSGSIAARNSRAA